jgi:hypothetical protein
MTTKTLSAVTRAYIVSAHAHAARIGAKVGEEIYINAYFDGELSDSNGSPIPPGCNLERTPSHLECEAVTFKGIDEDGNFVVADRYSSGEIARVPYTFAQHAVIEGSDYFDLNDEYSAQIVSNGQAIEVGCQTFKVSVVRELLAFTDKYIADRGLNVGVEIDDNPRPTYVPPAPRAAKKAAKKATKKTAKKATKRARRAR